MTGTATEHNEGDGARMARRDLVVLLLAAAALQAIAWTLLLSLFSAGRMGYGLHQLADTLLYQQYAGDFRMGLWPYSRIPVEYPPLANLVFLVAPSGGTVATYERWFSAAMMLATTGAAVLTTAAAALIWRSVRRAAVVAVAYAVLTLCCGALALNRYDAVVALVVAAALLCFAARRWLPAGVSLGLGFALKLTPALLLPLLLVLPVSRRRALTALAAFAVAAVVPFLPFVVQNAATADYPFTYHSQRPLQLESVPALPWTVGALAGVSRPAVVDSFGSQNFSGPGPHDAAAASPWLLVLGVAAVYALVWRRREAFRASPALVPVAALAALLVAICTSKVLSPQFLIWTFPVVALCVAQRRPLPRLAAVLTALAVVLTQVEFPARYWDLVALHSGPLAVLAARNVVLLAATATAVAAVARATPEAAAETSAPGVPGTHRAHAGEPSSQPAVTSRS